MQISARVPTFLLLAAAGFGLAFPSFARADDFGKHCGVVEETHFHYPPSGPYYVLKTGTQTFTLRILAPEELTLKGGKTVLSDGVRTIVAFEKSCVIAKPTELSPGKLLVLEAAN
jgi:hypothetical protein